MFSSTMLQMGLYDKFYLPQLKERLKLRGLPVSGNKATLIHRLEENDRKKSLYAPSSVPPPSNSCNLAPIPNNNNNNDANMSDSSPSLFLTLQHQLRHAAKYNPNERDEDPEKDAMDRSLAAMSNILRKAEIIFENARITAAEKQQLLEEFDKFQTKIANEFQEQLNFDGSVNPKPFGYRV